MHIKLILILLAFEATISNCLFKSKFKEVKNRAKQYYQKHLKKNKSWHFLGGNPQEYPGTNEKYREENEKEWKSYYDCLKEQENNLGAHNTPVPEALQRFEGGSVKFECKLCLSPAQQLMLDSVEWYYGQINSNYLELVLYNEHIFLSPEDKNLHIYNLHEEHSGQYVCILGDSVTVPYYLNVVNASTDLTEVHSEGSPTGPYPKEIELLEGYNMFIDSDWGPWSPCNKCNKVGKRHRIGYCVVKINNQQTHHRRSSKFETLKQALFNESFKLNDFGKEKKKHTNDSKDILPIHVELVKAFKYGIPCKSHILPSSIANFPVVKHRKDEIMVGFCKEKCANNKVFEVYDKSGKVIETANNSAGIYSMLQGIPPAIPSVERRVQYAQVGKKALITCPGNLNEDTAIHWQINSKNVVPELIYKESKGRVFISLLDRIIIEKLHVMDENLYSCWQNNELAGTVRLIVDKRVKLEFNHHIMLFGMLIILSTFLYVFVKALFGRKVAKRARK